MLLCAFAFGALAMLGERGMVHPSSIWLAPLPDGNYAIALQQPEFLSNSTNFRIGRIIGDAKPQWIASSTGALEGIETFPDGSIVAYSGGQALRWPASAPISESESDGATPIRLVPPPMTGSVRVPGLAGDRVLYAWISGDGLRVAPAREPNKPFEAPTRTVTADLPPAVPAEHDNPPPSTDPGGHWVPLPAKLDISASDVAMASYQASTGRHHLVLLEASESGRTIRSGSVRVVSFDLLESWEPADGPAPQAKPQPAASAEPAEPTATPETPAESQPGESTPQPAEAPANQPAELPTAEPAKPASLPEGTRLVRTIRPGNITVHTLAESANRFWSAATTAGVTVAWREPRGSDSLWRAATGSNDHFTPMTTLAPPGAPFAERPNFIATPDGLELLVPTPVVDRLDRHAALLTGDGAGAWKDLGPVELGRSNLPLPVETLLMLMIFAASAGLMGMAWLNVNRSRDAEQALAEVVRQSTGRDTTRQKETGVPAEGRIQWATMTRRGFAFLIDFIAISPLVIIVCEATGVDADAALTIYPLRQTYLLEGLGPRLVTLGIFGAYAFTCEVFFGRSLGKMVLGLRVVTRRGARPGMLALFVRNAVRTLELCAPVIMVVALGSMVFTRRNQRVGDVLAGTGVRYEDDDSQDDDNMPTEWDR